MGVFCLHPKCEYWSGEKHSLTGYGCTFDWEKYRSDRKKKIYNQHPSYEHNALAEATVERRGWVANKAEWGNRPSSLQQMNAPK